jgi:hypothetical protein
MSHYRKNRKASANLLSELSIAVVAGLAIWFAIEHQARLRLADEHQALKQQLDRMAGLIATNEQLSNQVARAIVPQSALP